jgi:hypothetical protein
LAMRTSRGAICGGGEGDAFLLIFFFVQDSSGHLASGFQNLKKGIVSGITGRFGDVLNGAR